MAEEKKIEIQDEIKKIEEIVTEPKKIISTEENPVKKNDGEAKVESSKTEKEEEIKPAKKGFSLFSVSLTEKVFLAKHLATILKAGISLPESLRIIQKQSKGKLKSVLGDVIIKVEAGKALNIVMSEHPDVFDPLFVNMVKVGEKSGTLDQSLNYLSIQLSKDARLISKVKSAALYPIIVLTTAFIVGGGVSYFILPKLTKLFTSFGSKLPLATRILLAISENIQKYGVWWLIGIVGAIALFIISQRIYFFRSIWHRTLLRIPIAGKIVKNLNLARFSMIMGTLLKSGVTIDEALKITKDAISSVAYQVAIAKILESVNKGKSMVDGMDLVDRKSWLFTGTTRAMIGVGEKTGTLSSSLLYVSEFYEEEVDTTTKDLATTLEPFLLIFIAIIVGFVAIAIITPIYSILGVINK